MPVIKSAIKKLRQDRKREKINDTMRKKVSDAFKKALQEKSTNSIQKVVSLLDKAAKNHIYHRNKVARLKSRLSKLITPQKTVTATKKTTAKKTPIRKRSGSSKKQVAASIA